MCRYHSYLKGKLLIVISCNAPASPVIESIFQMQEHRWLKHPLMSTFGNVAETELIAASSKSERIVFGLFPEACMWFPISKNKSVFSLFCQATILKHRELLCRCFQHELYSIEKHLWADAKSLITLPIFQISKKLDSLICHKYQKSIKASLSKSRNCSTFSDNWYCKGNT